MIVLCMPLCGYTIKGGVTYTVETARKEAFADVEYTLPKSIIEANKVDPNYKENMNAKANGVNRLNDRYINFFDDDTYGVVYYNKPKYGYYYFSDGKLEAIEKQDSFNYPVKKYKFDLNGKLKTVSIHVASRESYVFNLNGQLKWHWINDKCYDLNGKVVGKRYE